MGGPTFLFRDRRGGATHLDAHAGETVRQLLMRHYIPPASTVTMAEDRIVADTCVLEVGPTYTSSLIEGYDVDRIRSVYAELDAAPEGDAAYVHRRLELTRVGGLAPSTTGMDLSDVADYVENTILETCHEFSLVRPDDAILIGLSGGVDSSSLAIAMHRLKDELPRHRLVAVTFEDYDSRESPTFQHAAAVARDLDIEHHVAPAGMAEEIFRLRIPLREVLLRLVESDDVQFTMYIDHHTTRRTLEEFARRNGLNKISLGLHVTDLVAGLLNGWVTGYDIGPLPLREVGDVTYVYPLAFVNKRELHLYHRERTGVLARHSTPNPWELNPLDRNFYYFLADVLQTYWPGMELMLFAGHKWRGRRGTPSHFETCSNCGSVLLHQAFTPIAGDECDACAIFRKHGYLLE